MRPHRLPSTSVATETAETRVNLTALVRELDAVLAMPRQGLPEELFLLVSRLTPLVNVDLLIQDDAGRTLLTWRDDEFFGRGWHLPGGVIRFKEAASTRIVACALEELGVEVSHDAEPVLVTETIREPRARGHLISLLYRCRLVGDLDDSRRAVADPPAPGQWKWHTLCPPDLLPVQARYARFFRGA